MQKCTRCGFDQSVVSKFCSKCGAIRPDEKRYFEANKLFLQTLAVNTKDKQWFELLNTGVVTDAE